METNRLSVYTALLLTLVALVSYSDILAFIPLELWFPGHLLYVLSVYSHAYPKCNVLRKLLVCGTLSFADMIVSAWLLNAELPKVMHVLVLQFLVLFLIVHNVDTAARQTEFSSSYFRAFIFFTEAYVKSTSLTASLGFYMAGQSFSYLPFLLGMGLGSAKLVVMPAVTYLDRFFCEQVPLAEISKEDVVVFGKCGVFLSSLLLVLQTVTERASSDFYFSSQLSVCKVVANVYFLLWYSLDAVDPEKQFVK